MKCVLIPTRSTPPANPISAVPAIARIRTSRVTGIADVVGSGPRPARRTLHAHAVSPATPLRLARAGDADPAPHPARTGARLRRLPAYLRQARRSDGARRGRQ